MKKYALASLIFAISFMITIPLWALKPWTIMVYLNGDNNLESYGQADCDEMEHYAGSDTYNVIVQFDGKNGYNDLDGSHTDTRRYWMVYDTTDDDTIDTTPIDTIGEANMGDALTLSTWGIWGIKQYPAARYLLDMWDHGNSWKGKVMLDPLGLHNRGSKDMMNDDTDSDQINFCDTEPPGEYERALKPIQDTLGRDLDIAGFDACLMGMNEIMYISKDYAEIQASSEETEGADGWEYNYWLDTLDVDPEVSSVGVAKQLVRAYAQRYDGTGGNNPPCFSAVDLKQKFTLFTLSLDKLARELIRAGGRSQSDISSAISNAYQFAVSDYRDLRDFTTNVRGANLNADLNAACDTLLARMGWDSTYTDNSTGNGVIIAEWHDEAGPHGISMYFGTSDLDIYARLPLAKNTLWNEFLGGWTKDSLPLKDNLTYERYQKDNTNDPTGYYKVDDASGNGDGIPDPGENVNIYLTFRNSGGKDATGITAKIRSDYPKVIVTDSTANFPDIAGSDTASSVINTGTSTDVLSFEVANDAESGRWVDFEVEMAYTGKKATTKIVRFPVQIGNNPYVAVKLSSFVALTNNEGVVLAWRSESEANIREWWIEKADKNIGNYKKIAVIPAKGERLIPANYKYTDTNVEYGTTYLYRLGKVNYSGNVAYYGPITARVVQKVPDALILFQNSPNPFAQSTIIGYQLAKRDKVEIKIYNITGRIVKTLVNKMESSGYHRVTWDGKDDEGKSVPDGLYLYQLKTPESSVTKRLILIK